MRIKTYFVKSVEEAISQARLELGPDALLLNTRRLMQAGKPNGYEVVLGVKEYAPAAEAPAVVEEKPVQAIAEVAPEHVAPEPVAPVKQSTPPALPKLEPAPVVETPQKPVEAETKQIVAVPAAVVTPVAEAVPDHVSSELKRLHAQMDEIQALLLRSNRAQALGGRVLPELGQLYSRLLEAQVDTLLAKDIVDRLEATIATDAYFMEAAEGEKRANRWKASSPATDRVAKFLKVELEKRIRIVPTLGVHAGTMSPVTVLVGPTGGGKTTTVAKLAVTAAEQAPVRLLSLDWSRPGASQQLQALAVAPNIGFAALDTLEHLPEMFQQARRGHCVLVDTAGFAASQWGAAEALAEALSKCEEVDIHLAVPAYMNAADFRRVLERYQIFKPSKLLITKMDEAQAFGPAFSEAVRAGLALSFVTNGPGVPDDIDAASLDSLVALSKDLPRGAQRAA